MEKQEAILFILQGLEQQRSETEIAVELSQQLGVPYEIVRSFVERVAGQNVPRATRLPTYAQVSEPNGVSSSVEIPTGDTPVRAVARMESEDRILFPIVEKGSVSSSSQDRFNIWLHSSKKRFLESWSIFSRNKLAMLGLFLLSLFVVLAALHPILMGKAWPKRIYDPVTGFDMEFAPHPSGFSARHLLGTDTLGRDVLSILMAATWPSLAMAFTATITATLLGTVIGAVSAYFRGVIDGFFSGLADISLLAPAPLIMVIIGFTLNITPIQFGFIYGILAGIGVVAIVLRSYGLEIVSRTYIEAAKVAGGSSAHILLEHVFPHLLPLAAVSMLFTVTGAIFASGFIAFLGLSRAQLNWGSMIYDAFTYEGINGVLPWNVLIPSALAISLFAASFFLIALGLQDVVEPRKSERRLRS